MSHCVLYFYQAREHFKSNAQHLSLNHKKRICESISPMPSNTNQIHLEGNYKIPCSLLSTRKYIFIWTIKILKCENNQRAEIGIASNQRGIQYLYCSDGDKYDEFQGYTKYGPSFKTNDIIRIEYDSFKENISFYKNNKSLGIAHYVPSDGNGFDSCHSFNSYRFGYQHSLRQPSTDSAAYFHLCVNIEDQGVKMQLVNFHIKLR